MNKNRFFVNDEKNHLGGVLLHSPTVTRQTLIDIREIFPMKSLNRLFENEEKNSSGAGYWETHPQWPGRRIVPFFVRFLLHKLAMAILHNFHLSKPPPSSPQILLSNFASFSPIPKPPSDFAMVILHTSTYPNPHQIPYYTYEDMHTDTFFLLNLFFF